MIELPEGCFTVIRDQAEVKTASGIIIPDASVKKPNTGTIVFTAPELKEYQLLDVVFREQFGEEIEINGKTHLFFRDFKNSIYYVIKRKD